MRALILIGFLLTIPLVSAAELDHPILDSLKRVIRKQPSNYKVYKNISDFFIYSKVNHDSSLYYIELYLEEAKKDKSDFDIGFALHRKGVIYYYKKDYISAIDYYQKAKIVIPSEYLETLGEIHRAMGIAYFEMGIYDKALKSYHKAIDYFEDEGSRNDVGKVENGIGEIYEALRMYDDALSYYNRSLEIKLAVGDSLAIANTWVNLGKIYYLRRKYDRALKFYDDAIRIFEREINYPNLTDAYSGKGLVLSQLGKLKMAEQFAKKAKEVAQRNKNLRGEIMAIQVISKIAKRKKDYQSAIDYLNKAAALSRQIKSMEIEVRVLEDLREVYQEKGDYKKAFFIQNDLQAVKEMVFGEKTSYRINELQEKYRTEQIEKENELLKARKAEQDAISNKEHNQKIWAVSIAILTVVVFVLGLLFNRKRIRERHEAHNDLIFQNKLVEDRNRLIEIQKNALESKNKDITDSILYARRLQNAILPRKEYISQFLEDYFILHKPKDIVSGDFYWYHNYGDTEVLLAIDCTGHGVPGAFMSMFAYNIINNVVNDEKVVQPSTALNMFNKRLNGYLQFSQNSLQPKDGMDLSMIVHFKDKKELHFSGAMRPIYIVRDGDLLEYKGTKSSIGSNSYNRNVEFENVIIPVKKGDIVYQFTDGYPDQFGGERNKKLRTKPFKRMLLDLSHLPMEEQKEELDRFFEEWRGIQEQVDDILIFAYKIP
ncbi:MAG: tetratricopeptide repeat protein [Crocinitomicaceae bacterium]